MTKMKYVTIVIIKYICTLLQQCYDNDENHKLNKMLQLLCESLSVVHYFMIKGASKQGQKVNWSRVVEVLMFFMVRSLSRSLRFNA